MIAFTHEPRTGRPVPTLGAAPTYAAAARRAPRAPDAAWTPPAASRQRAALVPVPEAPAARTAARWTLVAVLRGDVWIAQGDRTLPLRDGVFTILRPGRRYVARGARDALVLEVRLSVRDLSQADGGAHAVALREAADVVHTSGRVRRAAADVVRALVGGAPDAALDALTDELRRYLGEAADRVSRVPAAKRSTRWDLYRRLEDARAHAERVLAAAAPDAPARRPLALADLARAVCVSPHHFARCFTAVYGEPPIAFVTRRRLERARALLEQSPALGSASAGRAVGFHNPSAFSRAFARHFGRTPTACRPPRAPAGRASAGRAARGAAPAAAAAAVPAAAG